MRNPEVKFSGKFTPNPLGGFFVKFLIQLFLVITTNFFPDGTTIFCQPVKIGLLVQDSRYTSAIRGAGMAVSIANEKGGLNGHPFQLVVRSMEGPWGTGSKQAVDLIFNEKVWALLGSHDGRNAHLVEQAATKSTVVFVSAWPADPTLAQAFVPWFFNCVPNDIRQAELLTGDIISENNSGRVVIVSGSDYDSQLSLSAFLRAADSRKIKDPLIIQYDEYKDDQNGLISLIAKTGSGPVILFCNPLIAHKLFILMKEKKMDRNIYGSLSLLNEDLLTMNELMQYDNNLIVPCTGWNITLADGFVREYRRSFTDPPGMIATFAYDGMNLLLNALQKAGTPDREEIQKALEEIEYHGITGIIRFDDKGNRTGKLTLTRTKRGIPASVPK